MRRKKEKRKKKLTLTITSYTVLTLDSRLFCLQHIEYIMQFYNTYRYKIPTFTPSILQSN